MSLQRLPSPDRAGLRRARCPRIRRARRRPLRELPENVARTRTPGPPPGPARPADRKKPLEETLEDGRGKGEVEARGEISDQLVETQDLASLPSPCSCATTR